MKRLNQINTRRKEEIKITNEIILTDINVWRESLTPWRRLVINNTVILFMIQYIYSTNTEGTINDFLQIISRKPGRNVSSVLCMFLEDSNL